MENNKKQTSEIVTSRQKVIKIKKESKPIYSLVINFQSFDAKFAKIPLKQSRSKFEKMEDSQIFSHRRSKLANLNKSQKQKNSQSKPKLLTRLLFSPPLIKKLRNHSILLKESTKKNIKNFKPVYEKFVPIVF